MLYRQNNLLIFFQLLFLEAKIMQKYAKNFPNAIKENLISMY